MNEILQKIADLWGGEYRSNCREQLVLVADNGTEAILTVYYKERWLNVSSGCASLTFEVEPLKLEGHEVEYLGWSVNLDDGQSSIRLWRRDK